MKSATVSNSTKFITTVFTAALMMSSFSTSAAMIKSHNAKSVTVSTSGLDLDSTQGQAMLQSKLQSAARQVCGSTSIRETGSVAISLENRNCVKDALENALRKLEAQKLAADKSSDNS